MAAFEKAFVEITPMIRGHFSDQKKKEVIDKVSKLTGGAPIFVGITTKGINGCEENWPRYRYNDAFNKIAIVYQTSSLHYANNVKDALIERFQAMNEYYGGAHGHHNPKYSIYVVWKEKVQSQLQAQNVLNSVRTY